mgnify:CR=1 FL=1
MSSPGQDDLDTGLGPPHQLGELAFRFAYGDPHLLILPFLAFAERQLAQMDHYMVHLGICASLPEEEREAGRGRVSRGWLGERADQEDCR